jgi:hypothetical protein
MARPKQAVEAVCGAPKERQSARRILHRIQACGQIVHTGERVGMLLAEHALAAIQRAPKERQSARRIPPGLQASGQIDHAEERIGMLFAEHMVAAVVWVTLPPRKTARTMAHCALRRDRKASLE